MRADGNSPHATKMLDESLVKLLGVLDLRRVAKLREWDERGVLDALLGHPTEIGVVAESFCDLRRRSILADRCRILLPNHQQCSNRYLVKLVHHRLSEDHV